MSIVTNNQYYEDEVKFQKEMKAAMPKIQSATVIELTLQGEPIIQFMGAALPSAKIYVQLKHYIPVIGDRVLLINNIILGGWKPL